MLPRRAPTRCTSAANASASTPCSATANWRLPPPRPARPLRRGPAGRLRQLRHLPRAGRHLRRHRGRPEGAVVRRRTGQRFGAMHVVNVLLGQDDEPIRRCGHERLTTFGIGTELDAFGWRVVYASWSRAACCRSTPTATAACG